MKSLLALVLLLSIGTACAQDYSRDSEKGIWDGLGRFVRDVGVGAIGGAIGNIVSDRVREERPSPTPRPERPAPSDPGRGNDPAPAPHPAPNS
jgi:hypothetical protein